MNGYAGKILRVNLSTKKTLTIPTINYENWVGGHGMGTAIFWDLVKDKTIDGFSPENVVTIMTSPLCGTLTPAASSRTEIQGIGVQSYPIGWFTRSNFGGRFSPMLKYAGWDGIVIEGKADNPVWIDIRNDKVLIKDAGDLWGVDAWKTQKKIWSEVLDGQDLNNWAKLGSGDDTRRTTQKPAVLAIGPAGENLSRMACLIHDASNAAGQGGFGAVWGAKNLKAISVIGTGDIKVHDPKALLEARLWHKKNYAFDLDNLRLTRASTENHSPPVPLVNWGVPRGSKRPLSGQRPQACMGCHSGCRGRYEDGLGNEASCFTTIFYDAAKSTDIQRRASDLLNMYGLNAHEMIFCMEYLRDLSEAGVLGKGREIECPLNFEDYGSLEFVEQFVKMIAFRNDGRGNKHRFGDEIAEGCIRAAEKWGRLDKDLKSGILFFPHWGIPVHRDPRAQLEWGYGTILSDRDINEHDFDQLYWGPSKAKLRGEKPPATAEEAVRIYTDKMVPFEGDLSMLDYSTENMYSEHMAKFVAWHRYYTRFWKQSVMYCDWRWPDFLNLYAPGKIGCTGEAEPRFFNAVTGKNFTFLDGIEMGRKIWNLDHAIWTLQGRHNDMVHFADFVYTKPGYDTIGRDMYLPGKINGKWTYFEASGRRLDKKKFEEFKSKFYKLQGWDTDSGYPIRSTLESLGLSYVADELEEHRKLGEDRS